VIVSHHNYDSTPPTEQMLGLIEQCFADVSPFSHPAEVLKLLPILCVRVFDPANNRTIEFS
jgi:hypothetical protein